MKISSKVLSKKAREIRRQEFEMLVAASKGHVGGAFSITDVLTVLYFSGLFRLSPKWQNKPERDRLLFSKGHASLALYAVLAEAGYFPKQEIARYGKNGTFLGGHPDHIIPGVEISSGSLGHGIGIAAGLALACKLNKSDFLSIAILGDGECTEGSVWEAAAFGHRQGLSNLIAIIDNNGVGATSATDYLGHPKMMAGRWKAFGWDVVEIDGHNIDQILAILKTLRNRKSKNPLAIVANTIKGKGVSFMEDSHHWHHGVPNGEQIERARKELAKA